MAKKKVVVPVPAFTDNIHKWQQAVWNNANAKPEVKHHLLVWHRRARKTTLAINKLITSCVENENHTYAYIGPTVRQAKATIWRDPMMLKRYMPDEVLKKPFNETELYAEFKSGSVLHIGGAEDVDRWRGTGCNGWVLDEFAHQRNGIYVYENIVAPIIRENGGWVWFLYTPKGRNHGYTYYKKAVESPNWEAYYLPASKSGLISEEVWSEIRKDLPERIVEQEYNCKFLQAGGGVISGIQECIQGQLNPPKSGCRYVIGADLARKEDFTVLTVINRDTGHVDAWQRFNQIDWKTQKERIVRLSTKYNNALVELDSTGIGDVIESDLKNMGIGVKGYMFTQKTRTQLLEKLIVAIEQRRVTFPDIEELIAELEDFDVDEKGRYGAPVNQHDDCVMSLALAIDALGTEVFRKRYDPGVIRRARAAEKRKLDSMANHGIRFVA